MHLLQHIRNQGMKPMIVGYFSFLFCVQMGHPIPAKRPKKLPRRLVHVTGDHLGTQRSHLSALGTWIMLCNALHGISGSVQC